MKKIVILFLVMSLLFTAGAAVSAEPSGSDVTQLAAYHFQNNLSDELGNTSIDTSFDSFSGNESRKPQNSAITYGEDSHGAYMEWDSSAASGGGFDLVLNNKVHSDMDTYTLALQFSFAYTGGSNRYRKILSFRGYGEDDGLYFLSHQITYYQGSPRGTSSVTVSDGEFVDMIISRSSAGEFTVYVLNEGNNEYEKVYEYLDSGKDATIRNGSIGFFYDDTEGIKGEATSGGKLYSLQLWSEAWDAVTETASDTGETEPADNETSFGSKVSAWAREEVEEAYENDLIPETIVGQDLTEYIDRAEFAAISVQLYEELSGRSAAPVKSPFNDVNGNKNIASINKAYALGIINGMSATTFEPEANIIREQLATMLCRTIKKYSMDGWTLETDDAYYLDTSGVNKFADDADISDYAKPSVYYMAKFGIIKGVDETHFAPKNLTSRQEAEGYATATREQAVLMSLRIFKLSELWNQI